MRRFGIVLCLAAVLAAASCTQYDYSWIYGAMEEENRYCEVTIIFSDDNVQTQKVEKGTEVSMPSNGQAASGMRFGWWEDQYGNTYQIGDTVVLDRDYVFSPVWITENSYVISGNTRYESAAEAVQQASDGAEIVIPENTSTDGLKFPDSKYNDKGISFDLDGNSLLLASTVGSSDTETNGMQLLKGNKVIFKDGVLTTDSSSCKILLQNYSNLTLDNVDVKAGPVVWELLSMNNGITTLKNGTKLFPITNGHADNDIVADVYYWPGNSYEEVGLVIETSDVEIGGNLWINHDGTETGKANFADKIIIIVPNSYISTIEEILYIDPAISSSHDHTWVPCQREGYNKGNYSQLKFVPAE